MQEQIRLMGRFGADAPPVELGSFEIGEGQGMWTRDACGLFAPELRVTARVVRSVAQGSTLFRMLSGVRVLHVLERYSRCERDVWSYVWGDLEVFETGRPVVRRALFLRGLIEVPDLALVRRYLAEAPKP